MYSGARANLESATDWVKRLGLQPLRETRKRAGDTLLARDAANRDLDRQIQK